MRNVLSRFIRQEAKPEPPPREVIGPLGEPFVSTLCSMYEGNAQLGSEGKLCQLDIAANSGIAPQQGMLLYSLVRKIKPENTLEIGLAYGFSTVYFLAGIHANGKGHHVAIDEFQNDWGGIGATRAEVLGIQPDRFEFFAESSAQSLSRFERENRRFEFIFIDGDHKFDGVLIDFTLAARLCKLGSQILLDDTHMPPVQKAKSFIQKNRLDFTEVPASDSRFAIFQMTDTDKRKWDHYASF